jgi:hypothetical protein
VNVIVIAKDSSIIMLLAIDGMLTFVAPFFLQTDARAIRYTNTDDRKFILVVSMLGLGY